MKKKTKRPRKSKSDFQVGDRTPPQETGIRDDNGNLTILHMQSIVLKDGWRIRKFNRSTYEVTHPNCLEDGKPVPQYMQLNYREVLTRLFEITIKLDKRKSR